MLIDAGKIALVSVALIAAWVMGLKLGAVVERRMRNRETRTREIDQASND